MSENLNIPKDIVFTISARGKEEKTPVLDFLQQNYSSIPLNQIDSVFGFIENSTLYGGRPYLTRQISEADISVMYENQIGVRIPFTTHYVSEKEYDEHRGILDKYYQKNNSIIVTNDDFARWIRRDYPNYQIEASIIKEISDYETIQRVSDIYDTLVLPMNLNQKKEFLEKIPNKEKITLFGSAGCALTCPNRICYEYISKKNKLLATSSPTVKRLRFIYFFGMNNKWCTHRVHPRKLKGLVDFDLNDFYDMGFKRFKMLREHAKLSTGY